MLEPPMPSDEKERIKTLQELNVLDTNAEEQFDRITRMAQKMFSVPIALVSLVDSDRQWFKSCVGLEVREIPRNISFCGHAILQNAIFVIPDAKQDERFFDNPLVINEPNIRFYAGCPIKSVTGKKLGTLCIMDNQPRNLTDVEVAHFQDFGRMIESEFSALETSTVDRITGVANRRGFIQIAQHAIANADRNKTPLTILHLELTNLVDIRNHHGIQAMNESLIDFSRLLIEAFRDSDLVGRVCENTFLVLLSNTNALEDANHLDVVISRLKNKIAEKNKYFEQVFHQKIKHRMRVFDRTAHQDAKGLVDSVISPE